MSELRLIIACSALIIVMAIGSCTKIVMVQDQMKHEIKLKELEAKK